MTNRIAACTERDLQVMKRVRYMTGAWALLCLLAALTGREQEPYDSPEDDLDMLAEVQEVLTALLTGTPSALLDRYEATSQHTRPEVDVRVRLTLAIVETGNGKGRLRLLRGLR